MSALVIIAWYMFILNLQLTWSIAVTAQLATEILKILIVLNFIMILSMQSWDCINTHDDPNSMWCACKNIFSTVIDRHARLRSKHVRASISPWITSHLKQRMHERDILKIRASRSNDPNDWSIFKKCRNSVNNEIKQAKENYYINAFSENEGNSRKTWGIINELTARETKNSHIKEISAVFQLVTQWSYLKLSMIILQELGLNLQMIFHAQLMTIHTLVI